MIATESAPRDARNVRGAGRTPGRVIDVTQGTCSVKECDRPAVTRGWCEPHYKRWWRGGIPSGIVGPPRSTKAPIERFWEKVDKNGPNGCWQWIAALFPDGYGSFAIDGRGIRPHRFAYELLVGPIPEGLQIDHLCRNRGCCNPDHLEPVTQEENSLRGSSPVAWNARKTHCLRGHPFDETNTLSFAGKRQCRTCRNARQRERWSRRNG